MNATIQDTLLDLFHQVIEDPDRMPAVPTDSWQEGSEERQLLTGFRDMLERMRQSKRQAEAQLREKEEQYRSIFEATIDGLSINDLEDGRVIEANPALCRMFGYTYEEFIDLPPTATIHPDTYHVVAEVLQRVQAGSPFQTRFVALRKDGTAFHAEGRGTPFIYKGKPHLLGSTRDITEQVEAEQQLREKEEQYRSIFEATYDGLAILDLNGCYVEVNPAICQMFGYTHEELIGMHVSALAAPGEQPNITEAMDTFKAWRDYQVIGRALRKDGTIFVADAHSTPFIYRGQRHILVVVRDITERVEAEQNLREREEQYRRIFEATYDGIDIFDLDGFFVEVNPAFCSMFGCTREEIIGMHASILAAPASLPILADALDTLKTGNVFQTVVGQGLRKDGTVFYMESHGTPFTYKGQLHLLGVSRDITERVEAEKQLREKEAQYRSIFEAASDALLIRDLEDGHVVEANPAACQMYGYSYEEFIGLAANVITHPDSLRLLPEGLQTVRAGHQLKFQGLGLRKDGTPIHVEVRGTPFTYKGKAHVLGVSRDITEQVQAQQLLEQRVEERTRELSSLLEISHTVASTLQLKPLLSLILDQLKTVVDYTGSSILTVEGEELVFLDSRSPTPEEQLMQLRFPLKNLRLIWKTITSRESIIIQDVREDTPLARAFRVAMGNLGETTFHYVRACMFVPLTLREQVIGMLVLSSSEAQAFTQHHATLALAIANQAAIAIENARLYAQAQELAALEERQKLARELHDSVSQALYGISLGAHAARTALERDPEHLAEPLDYILSLAEAALAEMRALIFELRPESLEVEGLVSALSKQAAALQARYDMTVQTDLCEEPALPLTVKQELYRIAQEALHNMVKHARASKVDLVLRRTSNAVILEVRDDGVGFDPLGSFPGHLGLRSMQERVSHLGGMLQIESAPGQGTSILAQVPEAS